MSDWNNVEDQMEGRLFFYKLLKGLTALVAVVTLASLSGDFLRAGWEGVFDGSNWKDCFVLLACGLYALGWWLWRRQLLKSRFLHVIIAVLLVFGPELSEAVRSFA